jgi:hypothetical protein
MKSNYERNREGLESVLKRVARSYAVGEITRSQFDEFSNDMEHALELLEDMEVPVDDQA